MSIFDDSGPKSVFYSSISVVTFQNTSACEW